jgi:choline dehydrogenase-like flavoprotein
VSIIDAREWPAGQALEADLCIVGAGAAGITLAAKLGRAGREVLLVESGGLALDARTQSLYDLESTGYPQRAGYMSRVRYFGGSCNLWAGRSMALDPSDFEARAWVPNSGWPLPYEEVARHYPHAARILGLPALDRISEQYLERRLSPDERALFDGDGLVPTISRWAVRPKRFGAAGRVELQRSRNIRVLLHASAVAIGVDEPGRQVTSLELATLTGRKFEVRAGDYVLACGGIENARLLLASPERQAAGIGNGHDLVGRFFMDHPRAVFGKVHVARGRAFPMLRGRPVSDGKFQVGIGLAPEAQRQDGLLNHYATFESQSSGYAEASYQAAVQAAQVLLRKGHAGSRFDLRRARLRELPEMIYLLSPKEIMPHALYRAYVAARDRLPRREAPGTYVVVYFCEQPPDPESRITLSNEVDALGVRRARLHWRIGPEVSASVLRLQQRLARRLEACGIGRLEASSGDIGFTDASHHMGTTRMSLEPRRGVVDTECKVHGVTNLYVAGSSVFPSAGYANPTLTIVALALRLATYLETRSRKG